MTSQNYELVKSKAELEEIADLLSKEISNNQSNAVSRFSRDVHYVAVYVNGKKRIHQYTNSSTNKELMNSGVYTKEDIDDIRSDNFADVTVARDLKEKRFHLAPKGIPLPKGREVFYEDMPSKINFYDEELKEFSKAHPTVAISRELEVKQRVIANSRSGTTIQSIPFFSIIYAQGYEPIPTNRNISAVCNTNEDIKNFSKLIKYLPDPTLEGRIKNSKSLGEAFHELYEISGLKHGSLEEAGVPLSELYDVVMLTGVPVHEIFGHHLEEPIRFLDFGESGTFKHGQKVNNKEILLKDDPLQKIEGFRVYGFSHVDAYGRKRTCRTHIENGQVKEFLGGEYADPEKLKKYLNLKKSPFVGSSVQGIDSAFPQPRMSCTVLDGKTEKVDLEGKILLIPNEGHTNAHDKTYLVKAHECYVIKDGQPRRVIPLQVTGGINQAFASLVLLDDESYQIGRCGKSDPLDLQSRAEAPVSQFSKSQIWRGQQVYPLPISDIHLKILQKRK